MSDILLKIDGAVEHPLALEFADLAAFPDATQFADVSRLHASRRGDGVTLDAILERAAVRPAAKYLILHADRDDFHVCVPLDAIKGQGIVVYKLGQARRASTRRPGPADYSRPICLSYRRPGRLREREVSEPHRADRAPDRDTRPETETAHTALHEAQAGPVSNEPG